MEGKLSLATRLAQAGKASGQQGEPTSAQMVLAAAYHLEGDVDRAPLRYGRQDNLTWRQLERVFAGLTVATPSLSLRGWPPPSQFSKPLLIRTDL